MTRLAEQIDQSKPFGLLGVSFGGIIVAELQRIVNPTTCMVISSVVSSDQLPKKYLRLGKTRILKLIPNALLRPTRFLQKFLSGAEDHHLLRDIIADTDPAFIRWALTSMIKWKGTNQHPNVLRVHGSHDRLIPVKGKVIMIDQGSHFMIVDRADEISTLVNKHLGVLSN